MSHESVGHALELRGWLNSTAFTDRNVTRSKHPKKKFHVVRKIIVLPHKETEVHCENESEARTANVHDAASDANWILTMNNCNIWDYVTCIPPPPLFSVVCIKKRFLLHFIIYVFRNLSQNSEQQEPADRLSCAPTDRQPNSYFSCLEVWKGRGEASPEPMG